MTQRLKIFKGPNPPEGEMIEPGEPGYEPPHLLPPGPWRPSMTASGDWDESKHPRDHGKFADKEGDGGEAVIVAKHPLTNAWQLTPDEFDKSAPKGQQWVFHATSYHQEGHDDLKTLLTEGVKMENVPQNIGRQRFEKGEASEFQPGAGVGQGLYVVAGDKGATSGYGRYLVGITVKNSDLGVPPESTVPSGKVEDALKDHNGAMIVKDVPPERVHFFGAQEFNNMTPHETLVYNAAKHGAPIPDNVRDAYLDSTTSRALREELEKRVVAAGDWDPEKHPRDAAGRFDSSDGGGVGTGDIGGQRIALEGREDGKGTPDDPIYTDGHIDRAIELLGEGKHVRLDTDKQASVLVAKLGDYAKELHDRGERAGMFDLCGVSVAGTNIFCEGNKGIDRISMPQLRGLAEEGTRAAQLRTDPSNPKESVSVEAEFTQTLRDVGIPVTDTTVETSMLRPTQSEINGAQAGYMLHKMLDGTYDRSNSIWTTADGYILDGHHRYVAEMAKNLLEGGDGNVTIPVHEVGMDIGAALDVANAFTKEIGLKPKSAG